MRTGGPEDHEDMSAHGSQRYERSPPAPPSTAQRQNRTRESEQVVTIRLAVDAERGSAPTGEESGDESPSAPRSGTGSRLLEPKSGLFWSEGGRGALAGGEGRTAPAGNLGRGNVIIVIIIIVIVIVIVVIIVIIVLRGRYLLHTGRPA
ncbi:hypothetical protein EYF80_057315 [Liparis tanakae]|uniref:Uncharacterized protein n=1 Tax=Liparis tanakae TaxID=230148 RepID=A0A4Z2EVY7_9TELE|nr:hypothetical protein EYF80_057315 [Liparis tanakae]